MVNKNSKIYIAGHRGLVGSACWKIFKKNGFNNLIGVDSKALDLRNQFETFNFFKKESPSVVIDAAAKVGGILANNSFPYEFLIDNMQIQNNLIEASYKSNVEKFIFLGSSCIYPKESPQPIKEEYLLTSALEETNQWYAIAKISGVKLCESIFKKKRQFISLMPTNLYGPNDNFDPKISHVIPALIRKFDNASLTNSDVELWGDGTPLREFLHVDDLCEAIFFSVINEMDEHIYNVGSGEEFSILEIASKIAQIIDFKGRINWNNKFPNGTKRKLLDSSKMKQKGWRSKIKLEEGLVQVYEWYKKHNKNA